MSELANMEVKVTADISDLKRELNTANTELKKTGTNFQTLEKSATKASTSFTRLPEPIKNISKALASTSIQAGVFDSKLGTALQSVQTNVVKAGGTAETFAKTTQASLGKAGGAFTGLKQVAGPALQSVSSSLFSMINPTTLAVGAILGLGSALIKWITSVSSAVAAQRALNNAMLESSASIAGEVAGLQVLVKIAKDDTNSRQTRLNAIKDINKLYPEYLNKISLENIGTRESTNLINNQIDALKRRANIKAIETLIDQQALKLAKLKANASAAQGLDFGSNDKAIKQAEKVLDSYLAKLEEISKPRLSLATAAKDLLKAEAAKPFLAVIEKMRKELSFLDNKEFKLNTDRAEAKIKAIEGTIKKLFTNFGLTEDSDQIKELNKEIDELRKDVSPKISKASVRDIETMSESLAKMRKELSFLDNKEIVFKTDESEAKIRTLENGIENLFKRFNQTGTSKQVIQLQGEIAEIRLKKNIKFESPRLALPELPPGDLSQEIDVKFIPGDYDEEFLRQDIIKRLGELGKKFDAFGLRITPFTSLAALKPALDKATSELKTFQEDVSEVMTEVGVSFAEGIAAFAQGSNVGNVLAGVFQGLIGTIGDFLIQMGKGAVKAALLAKALKLIGKVPELSFVAGLAAIAAGTLLKNFKIPGFAKGGYIDGPGSRTSDSIPARLSRGEYVIKAASVSKFGSEFFNQLNRGSLPINNVRYFAEGGLVSPVNSISPNSGVQVMIPTVAIRGQDLIISFNRASASNSRNS